MKRVQSPVLVLLPGMDGSGTLFTEFVRCLPSNARVRVVRYPALTARSYSELEELVISQLPLDESCIIVAESFSGPIALRIAAAFPAEITAAVLVSSFAYWPLGKLGRIIANLPLSLIFRLPLPDVVIKTFLLDRSASKGAVRAVRNAVMSVRPSVLAARSKDALASDYCREGLDSRIRVVAINAKNDCLLGRIARDSVVKVCPDASVEVVEGPHLTLQSNPEAVVAVLRKYDLIAD